MKVDERRVRELLASGGKLRVVLLYGDDPVLVADRSRELLDTLNRAAPDAFGPGELEGAEHARVLAELDSPVLGQARRVVRLRGATDAATASVEAVLAAPGDGLLLIEAGSLTARSRLRVAVERSAAGAAVACRTIEPRDLAAAIEGVLGEHGLRIESEARSLLMQLACDQGMATRLTEKLALLIADRSGMICVADLVELHDGGGEGELEDLVFAVGRGRLFEADRLLEACLSDGMAPAALLRGVLGHMSRVRAARVAIDGGTDIGVALAALRPPVFFRRATDMRATVLAWNLERVEAACVALWRADRACRQTASPAVAITRDVVWSLMPGVEPRPI